MSIPEIINTLEKTYQTPSSFMIYEKMFAKFLRLSDFKFRTIPIKQGSPIFRARYSMDNKPFKKLSDISYPPKEAVNSFSRLNRPLQNLFYASETAESCLSEMLPLWFKDFKKGDVISVTIGKWIVRNDLKLLIIPDTNNTNKKNEKILNRLEKEEKEIWDYFSKKFKTTTKQDKNIYEFTSALGNALWLNSKSQNLDISGFLFSSVQSPENVNIALEPKMIDKGNLVPSEFVETYFQREKTNNNDLPSYREIGERKSGHIDMEKEIITWI